MFQNKCTDILSNYILQKLVKGLVPNSALFNYGQIIGEIHKN